MDLSAVGERFRSGQIKNTAFGRLVCVGEKLTATLGTSSLVVLQQVQSSTDRSPRSALPQPSGLLLGVHPELLGVASIHLETSHKSQR